MDNPFAYIKNIHLQVCTFLMALLTDNLGTDVLTFVAVFIIIVVFYFKKSYTYWSSRSVNSLPPEIPFGNMKEFVFLKTGLGLKLEQVYKRFKFLGLRYGGFYFMTKPVFVPLDPEIIKSILVRDFNSFTDHGNHTNEEVDPMSGNMFSLRGNKWRRIRAKVAPTLTPGKMKMMFQTLLDCSQGLINFLDDIAREEKVVDMKDCMSRYLKKLFWICDFHFYLNVLGLP